MKYCKNCKQRVEPKKNVSALALIILLLLFILPGILYVIYCLVQKGKCPMCNGQNWGITDSGGLKDIEWSIVQRVNRMYNQ